MHVDHARILPGTEGIVRFRLYILRLAVCRLRREHDPVGAERQGKVFALDSFRAVRQEIEVHVFYCRSYERTATAQTVSAMPSAPELHRTGGA